MVQIICAAMGVAAALGLAPLAGADPTDDVRASAGYRRIMIPRLLRRAVESTIAT